MSEEEVATPTAAALIIGNEILSGKIVDENSPFLARELRQLGVDLTTILVVRDEIDVIASSVRELAGSHDHLFTSGGVGPTHEHAGPARAGPRLAQEREPGGGAEALRAGAEARAHQ